MLEAKIVTANGDIVIASEYQNEDLFYAMRGSVTSVVVLDLAELINIAFYPSFNVPTLFNFSLSK